MAAVEGAGDAWWGQRDKGTTMLYRVWRYGRCRAGAGAGSDEDISEEAEAKTLLARRWIGGGAGGAVRIKSSSGVLLEER